MPGKKPVKKKARPTAKSDKPRTEAEVRRAVANFKRSFLAGDSLGVVKNPRKMAGTPRDSRPHPFALRKKTRAPSRAKAIPGTLFQFKITLFNIKPKIWRRIQIPDCTLARFHDFIQEAMGWEQCHLHLFEIDGDRYAPRDPDDFGFEPIGKDESKVRLNGLLSDADEGKRWIYEYDLGDGWRHEIVFEGNPPKEPNVKYPLCTDGARACPPEDCGGPWGYVGLLEALADPKHESHDDMMEWIGPIDPEDFDAEETTKDMRTVRSR